MQRPCEASVTAAKGVMWPHTSLERQVKARSCPEVFARAESVSCASPVPGMIPGTLYVLSKR